MRNVLRNVAIGAALMMLAGVAVAQDHDWYRQRDERYQGQQWKTRMFNEIRQDIDHVQTTAFSGRDEYRLANTKQQLDELQSDLAAGKYEEPKLDEVIGTMPRVAADNHLNERDRNILDDDLQKLRDYRAHHEGWGR